MLVVRCSYSRCCYRSLAVVCIKLKTRHVAGDTVSSTADSTRHIAVAKTGGTSICFQKEAV